jgi:hypothetical protein
MKRRRISSTSNLHDVDGQKSEEQQSDESDEDLPPTKKAKYSINRFDSLPAELLIHIFNLADMELSG